MSMENIIPFLPKKRIVPKLAYQVEEKNGGFQIFQIVLDDKNQMVARERISDPDAWEQTMTILERELSKQFA